MKKNQQDKQRAFRSDRHRTNKKTTKKRLYKNRKDKRVTDRRSRVNRHKQMNSREETINYQQKYVSNRRSDRHQSEQLQRSKEFTLSAKKIFTALGAVFVLALIAYTTILYGGKIIADKEKLVITPPTTIETEEGEIIWYLYDQYRLPVDVDQVPNHVKEAFIAIEDKRFYSHSGVDFRSIVRAIYRDIVARDKVEGGSTITQQLAKNLFLTNDKSWLRKIKEVMIALYLEREFTKDELLGMYLNVVYFGQGQYGIEAAANKYFYKSVEELTLEEGALLAGMIKAPNSYSPIEEPEKAKKRRDLVLQTMSDLNFITDDELEVALQNDLQLHISQRKLNPAYHTFVDMVINEAERVYGITIEELKTNRYRMVTSLNEDIQQIAFEQFQYDGYFPGNKKDKVEGAFVMMEQKSGEVVAALGGRRYQVGDLNRVFEKRQPGSTMKPIAVFAPALESGKFTPHSMLPDKLREWDGHLVHNYNNEYEGSVTLYDALRTSKNTSSYWLLNEIGIDYSKSFLSKMDIEIEDKGLSIALGGLKKGLTPIQLVEAYRTFVHDGEKIDAHTIIDIYDQKGEKVATAQPKTREVFTDQVAWNMLEMMREVVKNGTGRAGNYPKELAGKTGTTEHPNVEGQKKDIWFVGFTPEYVSALWMGFDKSDENHYLTGGSAYPTELTKKILTEVDKRKPLMATFTKPDHVQALAEPLQLPKINDLTISYSFGGMKLLRGKLEWTGTEDKQVVYHIYEKNGDHSKKIGKVVGKHQFIIDKFVLFQRSSYYIVPYDPIADREGTPSNTVELTF